MTAWAKAATEMKQVTLLRINKCNATRLPHNYHMTGNDFSNVSTHLDQR